MYIIYMSDTDLVSVCLCERECVNKCVTLHLLLSVDWTRTNTQPH